MKITRGGLLRLTLGGKSEVLVLKSTLERKSATGVGKNSRIGNKYRHETLGQDRLEDRTILIV